MVEAISEQGGMVDKFIGDAIMAGFGIPVAHEDDEDRGVRAGINMIKNLWEWNVQSVRKREKCLLIWVLASIPIPLFLEI